MWWGIGIGGVILCFIVAFTLGVMTLRNRHGWMFFLGIFFPILWIFGAFMRPSGRVARRSTARACTAGRQPDEVRRTWEEQPELQEHPA